MTVNGDTKLIMQLREAAGNPPRVFDSAEGRMTSIRRGEVRTEVERLRLERDTKLREQP